MGQMYIHCECKGVNGCPYGISWTSDTGLYAMHINSVHIVQDNWDQENSLDQV